MDEYQLEQKIARNDRMANEVLTRLSNLIHVNRESIQTLTRMLDHVKEELVDLRKEIIKCSKQQS